MYKYRAVVSVPEVPRMRILEVNALTMTGAVLKITFILPLGGVIDSIKRTSKVN